MASRRSSMIFCLHEVATSLKKHLVHPSRIYPRASFNAVRSFSNAVKWKPELVEEVEKPLPTIQAPASPAVNNIQNISSLQRLEKCVNLCQLMGRIGSEPQLRGTEQRPVLLFSLATHIHYRDEIGSVLQKTVWHRVVVLKDGLRETCFKYCRKGQRVFLTGEIQYDSIKDPETNYIRTVSSIVADNIVIVNGNNAKSS